MQSLFIFQIYMLLFFHMLHNGEMITIAEGGNPSLQNNIIIAVHFLSAVRIGF